MRTLPGALRAILSHGGEEDASGRATFLLNVVAQLCWPFLRRLRERCPPPPAQLPRMGRWALDVAFVWKALLTLGLVLLYYCFSIGITFYNKWLTKVTGVLIGQGPGWAVAAAMTTVTPVI